MVIKNTINLDMVRRATPFVIDAVQGETCTRVVEVLLHSNGSTFTVDDCSVSIGYKKPDGTSGWYDEMPDGTTAYEIENNAVTIKLAPQMLTVHGHVQAIIRIYDESGLQCAKTFPFIISVTRDPAIDSIKSENYYKVQNWEEVNAEFANIWNSLEGTVLFTKQKLTDEQKTQARKNIGVEDTLLVYINNNVATSTSSEIMAHIAKSGSVICLCGLNILAYSGAEQKVSGGSYTSFVHFRTPNDDTGAWTEYTVDPEGVVTVQSRTPVLGTPQTLTPEQQAQARDNIGVKDMLLVEINVEDAYANATAVQIHEHIKNGGAAVACCNGIYYQLTRATLGWAEFNSFETEQDCISGVLVWDDGSAEYYSKDIVTAERMSEHRSESNQSFASAIRGTATGNPVCITDCSPVEHELAVTLSSDTVEDFSSVTVTKRGFNLFDWEKRFTELGYAKQEDGSWLGGLNHIKLWTPPVQAKGSLYMQVTGKITGVHNAPFNLRAYYTDGTMSEGVSLAGVTEFTTIKKVTNPQKTVSYVQLTYGGAVMETKEAVYIKDVMFSYADGEYVPYTAETQTFTPNADGTVNGIIGNGEPMTLITDDPDTTITAQYNRDTNKVVESLVNAIVSLGGSV